MNKEYKKTILIKFLKKKIGKKKFEKILPNQNLLEENTIDSLDLAEIHLFFEKKLKNKINYRKFLSKNNKITLNNIYKCL